MSQNNQVILELEGPLAQRIIDELNTTPSQSDKFIEDLNENISQVKQKSNKINEDLSAYAQVFEAKKLKGRELFAEMDDLLEWLADVNAKFSNLEPISHQPDVICVQLDEQNALNGKFF